MWLLVQIGTLLRRETTVAATEGTNAGDSQEGAMAEMVAVVVRCLSMMSAGYYGKTGHWVRECKKKRDEQAHVAQADEEGEAWWRTPVWLLRPHWRMLLRRISMSCRQQLPQPKFT
jgi:hypothetical protein